MHEKPKQVKFINSQNPLAKFDMIRLEELLLREEAADHSPFDFHRLEFYLLMFIEKGSGIHSIDFNEYEYEKGTVLTVRKDQVHKFHRNSKVAGRILLFTDEFLIGYLDELEALKTLQLFNELLSHPVLHLNETDFLEIKGSTTRLQKEYFTINDSYSQEIIRSELHILLTKLFRIKAQSYQAIYNRKYLNDFIKFQSFVEKQASRTIKVKDYAAMMHLSSRTLNNITKDIVNKSAKEFIDDICIKQIKRLLINTPLSVKEIAYTSGFEESSNFYKYFKHRTKLTPEQFRNTF